MQANRAMCFQKNCTKPERIGETFINASIANAVGDGSWRISGLVDTAHHAIGNGIVFTVPSAVIRLPVESILLPVPRTVSDGAGNGGDGGAYHRDGDEGGEGVRCQGDYRFKITIDQKNRGRIRQGSSGRVRFARRGGNRGAGREDDENGIDHRKPVCLVFRDVR